jgi:hypothetical protein
LSEFHLIFRFRENKEKVYAQVAHLCAKNKENPMKKSLRIALAAALLALAAPVVQAGTMIPAPPPPPPPPQMAQ